MRKLLFFLSMIAISVMTAQPPYVPANGLKAWYPFTGNANDLSGNNLNGTVLGANLTTDRNNNQNTAYLFAENQEIVIPNTENLNTYPLTISLWYNSNSLTDGISSNIFSKYVPTAWNGFQILLSDCRNISNSGTILNNGFGVSSWYLRDFNNKVIGYYNEPPFLQQNISSNVWYHYVFVLDDTGGKIYSNGNLIDWHPWTGTSGASTSPFLWKIGGFYNSWYNGKIDDIGIWNRALTQEEITNLYLADSTCQSLVINTGILSFNPLTYNNTVHIYSDVLNNQILINCGNLSNVTGYNIKIINSAGQEVFSGAMNIPQYVVSLNTLGGSGIYYVKIYDGSGNILNTKKIILQ